MPTDAPQVFYLPGNHLYPLEYLAEHRDAHLVMVEDLTICTRRYYHQQKLALLIAAMREHAELLQRGGFNLSYFPFSAGHTIPSALEEVTSATGAAQLCSFKVTDTRLQQRLQAWCKSHDISWSDAGDPGFMTDPQTFRSFVGEKSRLRMADFYKRQRLDLSLLLEPDGSPRGGQWSFDTENRNKLPRKQPVPDVGDVDHSATTLDTVDEISERFSEHPGQANQLWLPTTRSGALAWLERFLQERLVGFGTYEDAITKRSATVFHSALSPLINLGLLTPKEVVDAIAAFAAEHDVPLNDLEGILRQLIGWREFVRGVYDNFGESMRSSNMRGNNRSLTQHWHDGTTGIAPLDAAIQHQQTLGWNHHINRLMVLANLMNLCEIKPNEVYEYFMTYYVDAYDWVMVPNVYGMGLNCEGGVFATKPYICGSNYLLKMGDFPRGDWCDVVDGLYWRFVANNLEELKSNQRLAMFASGLNRLAEDKKQRIFSAADAFLDRCTHSQ